MSDPENFLARWSRRKREVTASGPQVATPETPAASAPDEFEAEMAALTSPNTDAPSEDKSPVSVPAFDPASLPSVDSIGADTDIRGFLAPGVPAELAHAALRRVWMADPGIRDFKGLADYDWDFTAPGSMFGFGELDASTDVKQMLADVFGELAPDAGGAPVGTASSEKPSPMPSAAPDSVVPASDDAAPNEIADNATAGPDRVAEQQPQDDLVQRNVDVVVQNYVSSDDDQNSAPRRSHGGALPQ